MDNQSYLVLGIDDQLPQRLVDDGVEEGEVVEAHPPPQEELEHVSVEVERAELVLQETQAHQSTHVAEGVQAFRGTLTNDRRVEAAFARPGRNVC